MTAAGSDLRDSDPRGRESPAAEPGAPGARRRRRYWLAALLLLAAVTAGAVLGAAGAVLYFERRRLSPPPSPEEIGGAILKRMGENFTLTPGETASLNEIIRRRLEKVGDIRRSTFAEIRGEFEAMHEEVGECLGPERFRVWDELEKERWRQLREKAGGASRHHAPGARNGQR